jgi:arylsulfatase A-like enzyme
MMFLGALFVLAVVLLGASLAQAAPLKPNIILVGGDDVGYGDVGADGPTVVKTPNINKIAAQGVRMEAGYSVAPVCTPSRAGLLTGRYPQRYGAENNAGPSYPHYGLPLTEMTLAGVLKNAGYATGAIGKWHEGNDPQFHPNRRGFDYFYGFAKGCCHSYFPKPGDEPIQRNGVPVADPPYTTTTFGNEAVNFINRNQTNPFFLYVAFNAAHEILQAPQSYINRYPGLSGKRQLFAAVMSAMDDEIGRIVAKADTLSRPTLIIFVSDNGATSGQGSISPFVSGGKGTLAEGGIRVPFEMRI